MPSSTTSTAPVSSGTGGISSLRQKYNIPAKQKVETTSSKPGFVKGLAQDIAKPFLKTGTAAANLFESTGDLGSAALAFITGDKELANRFVKEAGADISKKRDFGFLGEVAPVGFSQETGKKLGYKDTLKDTVGTALELGSYVVGGAGTKAVKSLTTGGLIAKGVGTGIKTGTASGSLLAAGSELQKKDSNLASVASETVKGGIGGAITGGLVGLASGVFSAGARKVFPSMAKDLQKSTLRLTPQQKSNFASKIDDAADFLSREKVVGTPEGRFEKVSGMYDKAEESIQKFLKEDAVGRNVPKTELLDSLRSIPEKYKFDRDFLSIQKQVDQAVQTIQQQFPDQIPLDALNQFKRSTYSNAYNKAGDKVMDVVEHDIGDVVYQKLSDAADGLVIDGLPIKQFNKNYSSIINARKFLKTAMGRKQTGFLARLISSFVGASIGSAATGPFGTAIGATVAPTVVENLAGTLPRSALSAGLKSVAGSNANIPKGLLPLLIKYRNQR